MKNRTLIKAACLFLAVIFVFLSGILVGRNSRQPEISFYAHVLEQTDSYIHVGGIPENDINHRGEFILSLESKNGHLDILDQTGRPIDSQSLMPNTFIQIFYSGEVTESYPAGINSVSKIILAQ